LTYLKKLFSFLGGKGAFPKTPFPMAKIQNEIQAQNSKRKTQNYNLKRKAKSF